MKVEFRSSMIWIWGIGAVFLLGLVAQGFRGNPGPTEGDAFKKGLPLVIDGWIGTDVPLGATEFQTQEVAAHLNYRGHIYRSYRKDGREVFLYAMRWSQGDISIREMAGHTPDGCWVTHGAKPSGPPQVRALSVNGKATAPAECRAFTFPGGPGVQVAWWQIWGGELVPRAYAEKSIMPMIREVWAWVGRRSGRKADQWFVRIHSSGRIEEAVQTAPAAAFLAALPQVFTAKVR